MTKERKNIPASVRDRLQNLARQQGRPFMEVLQYFGLERFLYRLSRSEYADNFILKGALLFNVWDVPGRRTTLDIDFLASTDNRVRSIEKIVKTVCAAKVEPDGLTFPAASVKGVRIRENADYEGVRVKFIGNLEKARIPMQIDIAFGDSVYPKAKELDYPALLDLPKARLRTYPPECVISEKFEAMIKLGSVNSRMKDFYDIWLMFRRLDLPVAGISRALKLTFERRGTSLPTKPPCFPEEFYQERSDQQVLWKAFLKKNGIGQAPEKLCDLVAEIEKHLAGSLKNT